MNQSHYDAEFRRIIESLFTAAERCAWGSTFAHAERATLIPVRVRRES